MYLCDAHVHTEFSYDSEAGIGDICSSALKNGLDEIVITDHYDKNIIDIGAVPGLDLEEDRICVEAAAEEYPALRVSFGIELGEPRENPSDAAVMTAGHAFDFVIGSVHNLPGMPDFYFFDYSKTDERFIDIFYTRYLDEMIATAELGGFDTLAHLNYPLRYIYDCGKTVDCSRYRDRQAQLFETLIKNEIALEVNTSGLTRPVSSLLPGTAELALYRDLGGKLLTIGSDAHNPERVGENIAYTHGILKDLGFESYTVFHKRKPVEKAL